MWKTTFVKLAPAPVARSIVSWLSTVVKVGNRYKVVASGYIYGKPVYFTVHTHTS